MSWGVGTLLAWTHTIEWSCSWDLTLPSTSQCIVWSPWEEPPGAFRSCGWKRKHTFEFPLLWRTGSGPPFHPNQPATLQVRAESTPQIYNTPDILKTSRTIISSNKTEQQLLMYDDQMLNTHSSKFATMRAYVQTFLIGSSGRPVAQSMMVWMPTSVAGRVSGLLRSPCFSCRQKNGTSIGWKVVSQVQVLKVRSSSTQFYPYYSLTDIISVQIPWCQVQAVHQTQLSSILKPISQNGLP